jgi:uncharacterized membrane protein
MLRMESQARSIAKALSYRLLGSACTATICYAVSGRLALSLGAGGVDMVAKLGLYFIHERIWDRIGFGRSQPSAPEYEI